MRWYFSSRAPRGASVTYASAPQQATETAASTAPAVQGASKVCAIHSPAPPHNPNPPRLPAWNQPPARPLASSADPYAIRLSVDIARKVTATFEISTTAVSSGIEAAVAE